MFDPIEDSAIRTVDAIRMIREQLGLSPAPLPQIGDPPAQAFDQIATALEEVRDELAKKS
jgi:hypothetical protein